MNSRSAFINRGKQSHFSGIGFLRFASTMLAIIMLMTLAPFSISTAFAQDAKPTQTTDQAKIEELLKLLDDPGVRSRLKDAGAAMEQAPPSVSKNISTWDNALHNHLREMLIAAKTLPAELDASIDRLERRTGGYGIGYVVSYLAVIIGCGWLAEWAARRALHSPQSSQADVAESRFNPARWTSSQLLPILVFAVVSLFVLLALRIPPPARGVILAYLIALSATRLVARAGSLAVHRLGNTETGTFWLKRVTIFIGWFLFAWATIAASQLVNTPADTVQLLSYLLGIGLVALGMETALHVPDETGQHRPDRKWLVCTYLLLLWCVWAIGMNILLWVGIFALVLPKAWRFTGHFASSFRPQNVDRPTVKDVLVIRGAKFTVVLVALAWLAFVLKENPGVLATSDATATLIVRALLNGIVILLAADLIWQLIKTYIDSALATDDAGTHPATAEATRRTRLRTLLPILRNALAVLIATIAGLMILARFGVEIAPLIAGASIFGVAIGFGSQTLVKDFVSGVFYLLDDAFRVGEYIQSGSYKGTVESFSLRSIRLRHHRGPVFTVPFGQLGAIQNMSRDWVIDKFVIRFPFDTDIRLVKKLTKGIGAALEGDAELGPLILQTLKMKGVEQIGDYGIDVSFAFMSKPGYQTSIRRTAYNMMRDTFAQNGIEFARPSVSVGSEDSSNAAGAASTIVAMKKAAEAQKA